MAIDFIRAQGGAPEASVATTNILTSVINAAMANAMMAHADETDDADPSTATHPGATIVPAALAVAERENRSGRDVVNAVVIGYELSVRTVRALGGFRAIRDAHRTAESYGGSVGAGAAAGSLLRLDARQMAYVLSYTIQQAGGVYTWPRDLEHIEKSFIFTGQSARNGVTAAILVSMGATGVIDVLDGEHNALNALATEQKPEEFTKDLGQTFAVSGSNIKSWGIGMPIQSAVDALLRLLANHRCAAADVVELTAALPPHLAPVVNTDRCRT
jgi:2-methylcitrate dehydratase PrpD